MKILGRYDNVYSRQTRTPPKYYIVEPIRINTKGFKGKNIRRSMFSVKSRSDLSSSLRRRQNKNYAREDVECARHWIDDQVKRLHPVVGPDVNWVERNLGRSRRELRTRFTHKSLYERFRSPFPVVKRLSHGVVFQPLHSSVYPEPDRSTQDRTGTREGEL